VRGTRHAIKRRYARLQRKPNPKAALRLRVTTRVDARQRASTRDDTR